MKPEQDDRWPEIRALEHALERHAYAYGLDCRGVGFTALASALVHEGWVLNVPAQQPEIVRARTTAETIFAKHGFPAAALYGPAPLAFREEYGGWRRFRDARREAFKAAALLKTARGGFLCTPTDLAQLFELDRAPFRAFQRKHLQETLTAKRATKAKGA